MAGFWVRRPRGAQEPEVHGADLARRAGSALVSADERIRLAADELGFAEAELGPDAIARASEVLVTARKALGDAFRLNRLDHAGVPGTADEVRARYARIVQLCESIEAALDGQTSALAERMARARRAPEIIAGVRGEVELLRARIPHARRTIDRLAARYAREALLPIEANPAEAGQLLAFAEHSAGVAERRRDAGQRDQADVALEASVASVRRAATLLDAVEDFELEALRAESTLAAVVEESRRDLAAALAEPRSRGVAMAIAELQSSLAALPAIGVDPDPIGHLARVREAQAALDAAVAAAREWATRPVPSVLLVRHAVESADRRLDLARDVIAGHPGWIGPEALTRSAEAERIRVDLGHCLGGPEAAIAVRDPEHSERIITLARRVSSLADEAARLARRDVSAFRSWGPARADGAYRAAW